MAETANLETVKTLTDPTGKRRVRIERRADGLFTATVERWYEETWEGKIAYEGWIPSPSRASFYQTAEMAEREVRAANDWLS
jgi:hypothetical protein